MEFGGITREILDRIEAKYERLQMKITTFLAQNLPGQTYEVAIAPDINITLIDQDVRTSFYFLFDGSIDWTKTKRTSAPPDPEETTTTALVQTTHDRHERLILTHVSALGALIREEQS